MRSLRNFLYLLVGLLLGCLSVFAFAADGTDAGLPGTQVLSPTWSVTGGGSGLPSASAACSSNTNFSGANSSNECLYKSSGGGSGTYASASCPATYALSQSGTHAGQTATFTNPLCTKANSCPIGSTLVSGRCTCTAGLVFFGGKCQTPKCHGTTPGPEMMFDIGTSPTGTPGAVRCLGGCMASFEGSTPAATSVQNGVRRYYAKGRYVPLGNGSSDICTAGPTSPDSSQGATPQTPADTCPAGHGMIKIDGKVNCVNTSTGASTAEPPQTDNKTTTRNQVTNRDNSTTVTTTTKNNITGGTTTVTETYPPGVAPGSGQPSGSSTVSTGGGAGGIGSGIGSGNGDGGGDKDACEDDPERVGCKRLDEILGDPVDGPDISTGTETVAFTPVAGFGSGSYSCPSNPSMNVSILGKSITVFDYAPVCQFASGVRPVVLAFAALAAALIGLGIGRRD